jgi:hypothetical protein
LLLGADAVKLVREQLAALETEINVWESTSTATDFD